jgi:ribosomal-protein-alanine N-acetyltransferase
MEKRGVIGTERLELVPATTALLSAELEGNAALEQVLGVRVPENWPPELYSRDAIEWFLKSLEEVPEMGDWAGHYIVTRGDDATVIGTVGFKGPPDESGKVEIGYSLLEQYQRLGYATEAARGVIAKAFADPRVLRVTAETYPHLEPSIGVMQRCGLVYRGEAAEPGVIYFELLREDYETL